MSADDIKRSISDWCSPDSGLEYTGDRSADGAEFSSGVRSSLGGAPVELEVLQPAGADRVAIRHTASASGRSKDAAQTLLDQRPGWVNGTVDDADTGTSVKLETFVYHDGFSKNSFMQAVAEISRSARLLGGLSTAAAAAPSASVAAEPASASASAEPAASAVSTPAVEANQASPVPSPAWQQPATPAAQPSPSMPAPSFTPQPQPQPQYQPQPAYQPQPQYQPQPAPAPSAGGWAPSHTVPPQGLRAWAAPDPSGPVVANLAPGLPIQVSEVRGAWARVICSNGWTGWIDGRIIGVAA